jgi:hypothetical protein
MFLCQEKENTQNYLHSLYEILFPDFHNPCIVSIRSGLMNATSKGQYHHQYIKNNYRYNKIYRSIISIIIDRPAVGTLFSSYGGTSVNFTPSLF